MRQRSRWISIDVSVLNPQHRLHPAFRGEKACRLGAWVDLLGLARWRDGGGLNRGEVRASERFLAQRWNWSRDKVRRFLDELETEGAAMRILDRSAPREPTTIIICNYCFYQSSPTTGKTTSKTEVVPIQIQKKSTPNIPESIAANSDVELVFEHWRSRRAELIGKTRGRPLRLTETRLAAIRGRLEEGYSTEDLKQASDGCLSSDWHVKKGHIDIELICRDQEHVDRYLTMLSNGNRVKGGRIWEPLQ